MSERTRQPWFQVSDTFGGHDGYDRDAQLARWLTYTYANLLAFDAATIAGDTRAAVSYLHRALPAFTAAALTRGETPEWAYETCVLGDTSEMTWEWLTDLGINPDDIAPATDDDAEIRGAVNALQRLAEEIDEHKRYNGIDLVVWVTGICNSLASGEVTI